jgi:hypothetical protein
VCCCGPTRWIPVGAEHPVDAVRFMDFVFRPEIAAMIAA